MALDPRSAIARYERGLARREAGRDAEAREDLIASLAAEPAFAPARLALAEALEASGDFPGAERAFREAGEMGKSDEGVAVPAARGLGRLLAGAGRFAEALPFLDAVASRLPDDAALHLERGFALAMLDRWRPAAEAFSQVVRCEPGNRLARAYHAWAVEQSGDLEAAEGLWRALAEDGVGDALPPLHLGRLRLLRGDAGGALLLLDRALAAAPEHPQVLEQRGRALLALDRLAEAAASLDRAVEADPASAGARYALARARLRLGERERAAPHLEAFEKLEPFAQRLERARSASRMSPGAFGPRWQVLEILLETGLLEEAKRALADLEEDIPGDPRLRAARERIEKTKQAARR